MLGDGGVRTPPGQGARAPAWAWKMGSWRFGARLWSPDLQPGLPYSKWSGLHAQGTGRAKKAAVDAQERFPGRGHTELGL